MSCIIVISSTEHWWVGLYSPLGHTGAPVLKNPAVLKIASAHKKSAAAVALRYDCTLALCLCVRLSASLSLWRFLPLSVALSIPPSLSPSIHPPIHPSISHCLCLSRRYIVQSGHSFVTASGESAYDKEDLDLFNWSLTAPEMQTLTSQ